jgi:DNA excision repair protein ERCC-5
MGVTGLWTVLQPCARPIKLETLNRKRLAIDASIWIYQFLKAVRDKEGHALRNAHVVGFFRRVCKLLFVGVKPVFVFDGGAPALKRETVQKRKRRREGRREDAVKTAGKLLGVQMRRRAVMEREEEKERERRRRRVDGERDREEEDEGIKDGEEAGLVYVEELQMTPQERARTRQFKKTDAYHLPALDPDGFQAMGAPNDPRIMSQSELEEYARQFHSGEDVNVYDFSAIDFNGPFFRSLPAGDRYNILNAARLRSRLRMGYSKEQLDGMFPDRMAFSRFQIERVKERNELTQRLMGINGVNGDDDEGQFGNRVAGEKGKEYVLVKNDGVEGGWALGVVSNKGAGGERNQPIDVDGTGVGSGIGRGYGTADVEDEDMDEEDEGFEDVPIEGLNRLPKRPASEMIIPGDGFESAEVIKRREALYEARQQAVRAAAANTLPPSDPAATLIDDTDSLFVPQASGETVDVDARIDEEGMEGLFDNVSGSHTDDDLDRAIAMSLEQDEQQDSSPAHNVAVSKPMSISTGGPKAEKKLEFNQKNAEAGRGFAQMWNARARGAAAALPKPFLDDSDDEEEGDDVTHSKASLKESSLTGDAIVHKEGSNPTLKPSEVFGKEIGQRVETTSIKRSMTFTLPTTGQDISSGTQPRFDGPLPFQSLNLGNSMLRKKKKENKVDEDEEAGGFEKPSAEEAQKPPQPLPPWFVGDALEKSSVPKASEETYDDEKEQDRGVIAQRVRGPLNRQETGEIIDLDSPKKMGEDIVEVESSDDEGKHDIIHANALPTDHEAKTSDLADRVRAEPPTAGLPLNDSRLDSAEMPNANLSAQNATDSEVSIEWEESDLEDRHQKPAAKIRNPDIARGHSPTHRLSPGFETKATDESMSGILPSDPSSLDRDHPPPPLPEGDSIDGPALDPAAADDEDQYSDPEEAELMRQLAIEAEEHARFASTLNSKSHVQNAEDYEQELRQLRNQQKKDRRDADEVSQIMITECQQLLRLFGIPYVTAPMEAEAQCAELVQLGLVDGIVTDDSDIFLFGGTRVYKNMFNQAKFVECYLLSDLEKEYSLDRHKLIRVAHLLGSDYTEGLPSVGPVTALEILSEFETLEAFAAWWSQVQLGQKLSAADAANPFRRKFARSASKLFLPSTFPDKRVDEAYLHPEVDRDPSPFAWGVPDLDALRQFLMATIGWSPERTDEVLVPVIKDMNRRENEGTQANITRFFGGSVGVGTKASSAGSAYAPRRRGMEKSKRMETALGKLHAKAKKRTRGEVSEPSAVDPESDAVNGKAVTAGNKEAGSSNPSKTRKGRKRAAPMNMADSDSESAAADGNTYEAAKKAPKRGKTRRPPQERK